MGSDCDRQRFDGPIHEHCRQLRFSFANQRNRSWARSNPSYARNAGVEASRGRKLLFVDADDARAFCYVSAMSAALESHPFVTSRVDSTTLNPDWARDAHGEPWQAEGVRTFFNFLPAAGVNIGVHRQLFDTVGGFSETLAPCEDIAFSWTAFLVADVRIHFVFDAIDPYRHRETHSALFVQSAKWGSGSVRLYRCFRKAGMPPTSLRLAVGEWLSIIGELLHARTPATRARVMVRLGFSVGRLKGSLCEGILFL